MADPRCLSAAVAAARRGWLVIPIHWPRDGQCSCGKGSCPSPAKHPLTKNGLKDATTDEAVIQQWWHRYPEANVAIVTGAGSGIVVLDIDPPHGGDESLAALEAEWGRLPETVEVVTGSGGRHIYFKHPGVGIAVPNSAGKLGPGLDVRGDGGYVLIPPSRHISWEPS